MIKDVKQIKDSAVKQQAEFILNRMLSAPKAKGSDDLLLFVADGEDIEKLALWMEDFGKKNNRQGFIRDASNIRNSVSVILLGAKKMTMQLNCGMCGKTSCSDAERDDVNCVFPLMDLGIAAGSGVSLCQEFGIDNRIMYTVGLAAVKLGLFKDNNIRAALGIPLQISSKNIFFDRK